MKRSQEIALLKELHNLKHDNRFFLETEVNHSPVARYTSPQRFDQEQKQLFRLLPTIVAHASELPFPGSFITRTIAGRPVLVARNSEGETRAFLNVCRHRGARLEGKQEGCKKLFTCPYHAWSYDLDGTLKGVPHEASGFPDLDRSAHALKSLPVVEKLGLIWVVAEPVSDFDFDQHLAEIADDFNWIDMPQLAVAVSDTFIRNANWKLIIEGGLEAYHFKVAHRETIGPHFLDNLSSYEMLGRHIRSVLPRNSLTSIDGTPQDQWQIRDHANVLYTVFPTSQFLLMQDHIAWLSYDPISPSQTRIRMTTLAPASELTPEREAHWQRNHKITFTTLNEDFEVNEQVQSGLESGANEALTFGRYEGALHRFNAEVEKCL